MWRSLEGDSVAASTANTHSPSLMSAHQNEIDSVPVVEVTANRRRKPYGTSTLAHNYIYLQGGTLCTPHSRWGVPAVCQFIYICTAHLLISLNSDISNSIGRGGKYYRPWRCVRDRTSTGPTNLIWNINLRCNVKITGGWQRSGKVPRTLTVPASWVPIKTR